MNKSLEKLIVLHSKVVREVSMISLFELELIKHFYNLASIEQFQKEVLAEIGKADKSVRRKIVKRLKEKRRLLRKQIAGKGGKDGIRGRD